MLPAAGHLAVRSQEHFGWMCSPPRLGQVSASLGRHLLHTQHPAAYHGEDKGEQQTGKNACFLHRHITRKQPQSLCNLCAACQLRRLWHLYWQRLSLWWPAQLCTTTSGLFGRVTAIFFLFLIGFGLIDPFYSYPGLLWKYYRWLMKLC